MTALTTRRPNQSAAADERTVAAALDKHAHELAARIAEYAERPGIDEPQRQILRGAARIVRGEEL
jgi:hypothetical protein